VLGIGAVARFVTAPGERTLIYWPARFSSIGVALLLLIWIRRRRPSDGMLVMGAVLVDAILRMSDQGPYFFNHYFLQAIVGIMGVLALGRQLQGERARAAWDPVALLAVLVWGLAGLKKILHGSYLGGEYLASTINQPSHSAMYRLMRSLLVHGGETSVPTHCCSTGHVDVSATVGVTVAALGIGIALAEISPVAVLAVTRSRAATGWLMLGLAIVATGIANEMDFGMTLIALAVLVGEGRGFRMVAYLTSLGLAAGYLWSVFR
jgi:hypothetical protein